MVESLRPGTSYKFLGLQETGTRDEKLALKCAAKVYPRRLSAIWSSPLSDINRVRATNQLAMPVLTHLMWTQHWPITEVRVIDREARKIICQNGGKYPLSSTVVMYLAREKGGRGLRSVERVFLVFTHLMRRPCWCTKQWQNVAKVLHKNRIKFPKDFFRFCSVHQHGRRDVT